MLLNARWHKLRGSEANPHRCPACDAVVALDDAVHDSGERYHPDCARPPGR
ncbi:MAG: hypothetical protein LC790_00790 [Actinobacteria bacterium]|nr:hypothetical protein [Actinomycetota bacterium]